MYHSPMNAVTFHPFLRPPPFLPPLFTPQDQRSELTSLTEGMPDQNRTTSWAPTPTYTDSAFSTLDFYFIYFLHTASLQEPSYKRF